MERGDVIVCRKQDFRELKQLQREEMKEATEFYGKIKVDREVQDRKFEVETGVSCTKNTAVCSNDGAIIIIFVVDRK